MANTYTPAEQEYGALIVQAIYEKAVFFGKAGDYDMETACIEVAYNVMLEIYTEAEANG